MQRSISEFSAAPPRPPRNLRSTTTASEEGASSPPPPASCISVAISHAEAMCTATERRCACSASHVDVDQLTSFSRVDAYIHIRTYPFNRV